VASSWAKCMSAQGEYFECDRSQYAVHRYTCNKSFLELHSDAIYVLYRVPSDQTVSIRPPPRMLIHKALSISDYGVPMVLTYVQT